MALFRTGGSATSDNGKVLICQAMANTNQSAEYTGTNGVTVGSQIANIPEADMIKTYTDAQVKNSSQASPFFTYQSGNQNLNVYYDNGNIVAATSNCPFMVIYNNI